MASAESAPAPGWTAGCRSRAPDPAALAGAVVQQRLGPLARQAGIHPAQRQQAQPAHAGTDQAGRVGPVDHVGAQRGPQAAHPPHAQVRTVGPAGQRRGVDGARRGAADDVEGILETGVPIRIQQLHDGAEHADLVARARPRSGPVRSACAGTPGRWERFQRGVLTSTTVMAVMLTMRRTVELEVRMCTGAFAPSRNGPTATLPPAAVLSRL